MGPGCDQIHGSSLLGGKPNASSLAGATIGQYYWAHWYFGNKVFLSYEVVEIGKMTKQLYFKLKDEFYHLWL